MGFFVTIRFTNPGDLRNQIKDLDIIASDEINPASFNTNWVKSTIRNRVPDCSNRRLRLIHGGKVLNENTNLNSELIIPFVRQQHLQQQYQLPEDEASGAPTRLFIHCLVGDILTASQLAEENRSDASIQERTTTPEAVGFDRLLLQGFTQDDIRDLRRQFQSIYSNEQAQSNTGSSGGDIQDVEEEERRQAHLRQLEERWIESTVTPSSLGTGSGGPVGGGPSLRPLNSRATDNQSISAAGGSAGEGGGAPGGAEATAVELEENSGNEDLLFGLLVGVFLGVLSLIFLAVDDTVFNKRQKMSIIAGLFINCSFAIVRGQWV